MFEAAGVSHDALSIASNEAPASARRNALERTAEQHPNDNFQEKDIPSCRTLKSSKAPTNYFTPNILRKSWSRLVVSVVHLDALAFPVAAT